MMKKRYAVPALLFGLAVIGGSTAYAFGPGNSDLEAFASFSDQEQAAIQQADDIRETAEKEAQAVLEAAGLTQDELRETMHAYRESKRTEMDAALEANDYEAFTALVAGSPMADELTEDTFASLVEIHELEQAGDREGASALRESLGLKGPGMQGHDGLRP
jgi:galactokinase